MNGAGATARVLQQCEDDADDRVTADVAFVKGRFAHLVSLLEHTSNARDAGRYLLAAQVDLRPVLRRLRRALA